MFKYILPKGKDECILFGCLILFYFICSFTIILNTSIIDNTTFPCDIYFGFDTPLYYHRGYGYISAHPLITIFTKPIVYLGDLISYFTGNYKSKTLFISIICNFMISGSCVYIYRYLKQIINLTKLESLLIILIYSIFSTNIILSFTIESFTLSIFFLSFILYYYSLMIKEKKEIPLFACIVLPLIAGGITITNLIIALFPILISKDLINKKIIKLAIPSFILLIVITVEKILISSELFDSIGLTSRLNTFTNTNNFIKNSLELFWGSTFILPNIGTKIFIYNNLTTDVIILTNYQNYIQYIIIALISLFILCSMIIGYKNKLILICSFILIFNVIIHVLIGYGLDESFIYGGNWLYIMPILMGWTYYYTKKYHFAKKLTIVSSILIFIGLFINNWIKMHEFINLAEYLFPSF